MVGRNLKIRTRILLGFGVLSLISLCMALFAAHEFSDTSERLDDIVHEHLVKISQTKTLQDNLNLVAVGLRNMVIDPRPASLIAEKQRLQQASVANGELFAKLAAADNEPLEQAAMDAARTARSAYVPLMKRAMELVESGDAQGATALIQGELNTVHVAYMGKLQDFVNLEIQLATEQAQHEQADAKTVSWILMAAAGASALLGAVVAWIVSASVTRPIATAVELADAVAAGDLTRDIRPTGRDETGHLLQALRSMNDNLVSMVSQVRMASDSIVTGSTQVAAGSADLSQRTESQAANLQQTAASLEQLTATVAQTSTTARQANELAHQASRAASDGGEVVGKVVHTMNQISTSSKKMSEIIGVIDGIAFQTNILALNAAVEAARAGEAGRGFAVVAGEVRSLAQRSAEAAREIKELIQASIANVETGGQLVADAGQAMGEIVLQVRRVTDLIDDMSHAAQEQTGGIQQINTAVAQMDEMTQQNAALVEESNAAAASLQGQATDLNRAVAVFRTAGLTGQHSSQVLPEVLALQG